MMSELLVSSVEHAGDAAGMSEVFIGVILVAIAVSVGIMAVISQDGETHWMEGVQLLAVYAILAVAFFFVPT